MNTMPDIINTPIIKASANAFWEDYNETAPPRALLVLTENITPGGTEDTQLAKMLQACKLTPEHYHLIMLAEGQKIAWHKLKDTYNPKAVLMLGIMPDTIGIAALLRLNEPNHFAGCIFIPTLSITDLESKPDMKRQLWNAALKPVFVDNLYSYH